MLMHPARDKIHHPVGQGIESTVTPRKKNQASADKPVSLKILADYLGLCPATVSVVLNNVPGRSIPAETRERVRDAARKFNYQPSLLARSLRKQRTFTEGIVAIDTALTHELPIPVVAVAGHRKITGVTNVMLDHRRAAELSLRHLHQLGHRHIAFMRGQSFSSDSDDRWRSLVAVAKELGIEIRPELTIQLE